MQEFDKAIGQQSNKISIASDYVGTLANNARLLNLLAKQVLQENEVGIFSSAPPEGMGLKLFELFVDRSLDFDMSKDDFAILKAFNRKPETPTSHFNIVFDDQTVGWCTYDYHIQAGTMAFDAFLEADKKDPNTPLTDIAKELSMEFKGGGINVGTSKVATAPRNNI